MRLAHGLLGLAGSALAGCSAVLGMDAPTLDPCASGGCADAGTDAPAEAGLEAGACVWDGGVDFVDGAVRCGGGCSAETACSGSTPVCCQSQTSAGAASYA